MRLTHVLVAAAAVVIGSMPGSAPAVAATATSEQWRVQAHAADAIGEVLMSATERAEAEVDALRREVGDVGRQKAAARVPASPATRPAAPADTTAAFRELN